MPHVPHATARTDADVSTRRSPPPGKALTARAPSVGRARERRQSWTSDDDQALRAAVARHGVQNWSLVSRDVCDRNGKQCRERWRNSLSGHRTGAWSAEEDDLLVDLLERYGMAWSHLSRHMGRSENNIKNRWNAVRRRKWTTASDRRSVGTNVSARLRALANKRIVAAHADRYSQRTGATVESASTRNVSSGDETYLVYATPVPTSPRLLARDEGRAVIVPLDACACRL